MNKEMISADLVEEEIDKITREEIERIAKKYIQDMQTQSVEIEIIYTDGSGQRLNSDCSVYHHDDHDYQNNHMTINTEHMTSTEFSNLIQNLMKRLRGNLHIKN